MMIIQAGVKVHLELGVSDMRKGLHGLTVFVQEGLCLFTKQLDGDQFVWPRISEQGNTVTLTAPQLAMLIEGIDWRNPELTWRPQVAA